MNLLTGQIDLNLLQSKIGIWVDKLTDFMAGQWVDAITNWIHLQIAYNIIWVSVIIILLIVQIIVGRKIYKQLDDYDEHMAFWAFNFIVFIILMVILFCNIVWLLSRTIAPEITFIQHFIK